MSVYIAVLRLFSIKVLLRFCGNLWKIKENEPPLKVRTGKPMTTTARCFWDLLG